jgi:hypothetical protein
MTALLLKATILLLVSGLAAKIAIMTTNLGTNFHLVAFLVTIETLNNSYGFWQFTDSLNVPVALAATTKRHRTVIDVMAPLMAAATPRIGSVT